MQLLKGSSQHQVGGTWFEINGKISRNLESSVKYKSCMTGRVCGQSV